MKATLGRVTIPLAVALIAVLSLWPAVSGSFLNWDDDVNFRHNLAYRGLGPEQIRWAFTSVLFGHYIPFTRLTFSVNYVLGGLDPWGYHLLNVLLHGVNAALFYVVARRLLTAAAGCDDRQAPSHRHLAAAAVTALVFAVHPLRVEPVAWVTGRADLLCAAFLFLSTLAYLRAVEGPGPARRGLVLASLASFTTALLSKGSVLSFPAALLLLDVYPLRRVHRLGWRCVLREKVPFLVVAGAGAAVVAYAMRRGAVLTGAGDYDVPARIAVASHTLVSAIVRFVWPAGLSPVYEMPLRVTPLEPRFGFAIGAAILVTAVLIALRRRWPGGLTAWTFSALMLLPLSAAVRKTADLAPDRYTYIAGLGYALVVGGAALGVARLVHRGALPRRVGWIAAVAGVAVIAALAVTSLSSARMWSDPEMLWRWAIELDPACSVCHSKLGEVVLGDPAQPLRAPEAEALFRRAIALRPDRPPAYFNLGTALIVQGRPVEAEGPLRGYMDRVPRSAQGPERLGRVYLLQSRYEAAIPLLRTALTRQPDMPGLRAYLGEALEGRARELQALGRAAEAAPLLAESRALASAN